jgi:hypothetical protein
LLQARGKLVRGKCIGRQGHGFPRNLFLESEKPGRLSRSDKRAAVVRLIFPGCALERGLSVAPDGKTRAARKSTRARNFGNGWRLAGQMVGLARQLCRVDHAGKLTGEDAGQTCELPGLPARCTGLVPKLV